MFLFVLFRVIIYQHCWYSTHFDSDLDKNKNTL